MELCDSCRTIESDYLADRQCDAEPRWFNLAKRRLTRGSPKMQKRKTENYARNVSAIKRSWVCPEYRICASGL